LPKSSQELSLGLVTGDSMSAIRLLHYHCPDFVHLPLLTAVGRTESDLGQCAPCLSLVTFTSAKQCTMYHNCNKNNQQDHNETNCRLKQSKQLVRAEQTNSSCNAEILRP